MRNEGKFLENQMQMKIVQQMNRQKRDNLEYPGEEFQADNSGCYCTIHASRLHHTHVFPGMISFNVLMMADAKRMHGKACEGGEGTRICGLMGNCTIPDPTDSKPADHITSLGLRYPLRQAAG